jgi:hypothetical protein
MEIRGVLTEMYCGFPHFRQKVLGRHLDTLRTVCLYSSLFSIHDRPIPIDAVQFSDFGQFLF